jgi:hypothetical protein
MIGDDDMVWGEVKTSVPLVFKGVVEKDTLGRAWIEDREVRVAGTPKDPKVGIEGSGTKEGKVGRGVEIALVGSKGSIPCWRVKLDPTLLLRFGVYIYRRLGLGLSKPHPMAAHKPEEYRKHSNINFV